MSTNDITVLVPLHRSARFIDVVTANLERLEGHCRLVVSDATEVDVALSDLQAALPDADITWLGRRPIDAGWIAHYNDLLDRVETPLLMWLPHDDEIDLDYLGRCASALSSSDPGVAGAFGWIDCVEGPGMRPVELAQPLPAPPSVGATMRAEQLVVEWNLGIAMRAVFRREALLPIAPTTERSEWADIVWLFGVVLEHDLVQVPEARYRKRFYAESEHASWRPHVHPHALPHLLAEFDRRPGLPDRERRRDRLIEASIAHAAATIDGLEGEALSARNRIESLEATASVERAEADAWRARASEQAALADATRRSGAFRVGAAITAPLRAWRRR